jgi:eukaryotic-like serine/threonine-protein kinase
MDSANLDTPPATSSPHGSEKIIAERYRLVRKLGEGAMGAVFLAEHVHMRKRFALKILHSEAMASPEIVARFEREAIAAGNINHPGVCAATDFGRLPDGGFFLVLEYIDGTSLRGLLREGTLAPDRALEIVRQIFAALSAAHQTGVVHRDMKPENVMITTGDVVKVLDFGIAKVDANTLGEGKGENLTRMGAIYGTPVYMAPEQALGKTIDHRADLYAVGVMLFEMLTGKVPFDGDGVVILAKHVNDPPPPIDPSIAPRELQDFVHKLMAKDPADRPADGVAAIAELERARASLTGFTPAVIATSPTVMGEQASIVSVAPTLLGEASPTPPPVGLKTRALERLQPLAKRTGVEARYLAIAIAGLSGLFFLLLLIVLLKPAKEDEEEARRPRRRKEPAAAQAQPSATTNDDDKPGAQPSSSSSSGGGKGGGGIKGIGRKIKSLF